MSETERSLKLEKMRIEVVRALVLQLNTIMAAIIFTITSASCFRSNLSLVTSTFTSAFIYVSPPQLSNR